uniref:Transmembrane protein 59 like n=1 Tax=Crocodylus porosus TaxID=8502 RepID=A0A7M4FBI2_CROPO
MRAPGSVWVNGQSWIQTKQTRGHPELRPVSAFPPRLHVLRSGSWARGSLENTSSSLPLSSRQDAVLNACYRGCRLFSICHFVDASAALNATRAECESACVEAYAEVEEQLGCATGCRKQLPEMESSTVPCLAALCSWHPAGPWAMAGAAQVSHAWRAAGSTRLLLWDLAECWRP